MIFLFNMTYEIKNNIVRYSDFVINDIDKVNEIKNTLLLCTNKKEIKKITNQMNKEKEIKRELFFELDVRKVKENCVDCNETLGDTLDLRIKNNMVRGNYCGACNSKYGK